MKELKRKSGKEEETKRSNEATRGRADVTRDKRWMALAEQRFGNYERLGAPQRLCFVCCSACLT